jgi:hypothetical protein
MPFSLGYWAAAGAGGGGGGAGAYEQIATAFGTGSSNTVTFSSIPSTYKHLQVRMAVRVSTADGVAKMQLNGDGGSNYAFHRLIGNGSTVASSASSGQTFIWTAITMDNANAASGQIMDILDYANTSKNTTTRLLGGLAISGGQVQLNSGLWLNTAAVTSISFIGYSNWTSDSRFSLYGIRG